MTLQTFGPHEVGSKYHVEAPTPKHVENSLHGSRHAKATGHKTNDLDMLPDEVLYNASLHNVVIPRILIANHVRNTHWPEPLRRDGFRDPAGILHRDDLVQEMVPHELDRLVAGHRWTTLYHIPTMEQQFHLCGQIRLQALIEPKHSRVWMHKEVWEYLAEQADLYHCRTAVYSLMHECLPFARSAGFKAWAI